MSEHDAHKHLRAVAERRATTEPEADDAVFMTIADRRHRQTEAKMMHDFLMELDFPMRLKPGPVSAYGMHDFRDGRREHRLLPHEIAQQDGFPDNE